MIAWLKKRRQRKCEEAGHPLTVPYLKCYYEWPGKGFRSVADDVTIEGERCRCGESVEEHSLDRQGIQSLSMSSDKWRQLEREGYLEY